MNIITHNILRAEFSHYQASYIFHLHRRENDRKDNAKLIIKGANISWEQDRDKMHQPSFVLADDHVQILMDDLYNAGVRPSNTEGLLQAKDYHLQDMRKLVFKKDYK